MSDNGNEFQGPAHIDDWTEGEIDADLIKDLRLKDAKALLWVGFHCGWRITRGPGGFVILTGPNSIRIEVPNNDTLSMSGFRSRVRKILRHRTTNIPVVAMMQQVIDKTKVDAAHAQMLMQLASEVQAVGTVPAEESQSQPESVSPADSGGSESKPAPVVTGKHRKRRITKEEPWSAHKGSTTDGVSTTYPSDAVMERQWNDGTKDYACRWEGCPFTHESPQSTARHNASHKRGEGKQPQPEVDGVDPDHTPAKRARIRRLRVEVDGALQAAFEQGIDFEVVDQAEWIATWIIEHRITPVNPTGTEEPTPMTAEEALDKIAAIVDRGRNTILREQIETLNAQVEGFIEHVEEVESAHTAAEARAKRAEDNLHAYRDLINDIDPPAPTEAPE